MPESVLEWYNEMIGPMHVTQKIVKQSEEGGSLMDYAATDTGTEPHVSSVFYRQKNSKGISAKSSHVKLSKQKSFANKKQRMAFVGQQTPFMTLN